MKPIYAENIIVAIKSCGCIEWYILDKDYCFLDYPKLEEAYRKKGYNDTFDDDSRFGIKVVNELSKTQFFPYDKLTDIVANREKAVEKLKEYLEKYWYVGHKNMGWYDIHKAKEKLYYGYWSFEAGAIAKILNLDDSNLKDVPYYPYDLVHYKSNSMSSGLEDIKGVLYVVG